MLWSNGAGQSVACGGDTKAMALPLEGDRKLVLFLSVFLLLGRWQVAHGNIGTVFLYGNIGEIFQNFSLHPILADLVDCPPAKVAGVVFLAE